MVGPGGALGLGGARVVYNARVNTVLVDTGLALRTVWVLRALRSRLDGVAAGERISSEARGAVTACSVSPDLTDCIAGTRVGCNAGVDAGSVLTDLSVCTVRVRAAAGGRRRREVAGDISVSHISRPAHADHRSLRESVLHGAVRVLAAGREDLTGVPAHLGQTSESAGAVSVHTALGLRLGDWETAGVVRVSSEPNETLAPCPVGPHDALGVHRTVTGVYTVLISTCQDLGTFLIHDTLRLGAGDIGVSSVAGGTVASGPVVSALTESIPATLGEAAGQHTVPVDTLVCQGTLQVTGTARFSTCSVRVALQWGRTQADSSVVVDPAYGSGAALLQNTGVSTLLSYTCQVQWTFRI